MCKTARQGNSRYFIFHIHFPGSIVKYTFLDAFKISLQAAFWNPVVTPQTQISIHTSASANLSDASICLSHNFLTLLSNADTISATNVA